MWVDGRNLQDDGWYLIGLTDWMRGVSLARSVTAIPGLYGVAPGTLQSAEPRNITLQFRKYLTSITDRDAAVLTFKDRLRGQRSVRFDDAPTRVVRCEASQPIFTAAEGAPAFAVSTIEASVTLTCYDGASYDTEPRILALATTPTEIPLGDLPISARILWGGAWSASTSRTLTVRDAAGNVRNVMTFTAPSGESLSSTDHHEIHTGKRYITKVTSAGTRTPEYDWYTSGTWLVLDPAWQDRANGRYLTAEVSAGTAQLISRRAYAL
jgi:hypothetical protein